MFKTLALFAALAFSSSAQDSNIEAVRKMTRELERALLSADTAALEKLLTDDFVRTPPGGRETNKSQYISQIGSGQLKYVSFQNVEEKFRSYSETVLVNDVTDLHYRIGNGPESVIRLKLLWVWVKQDGQWRVAGVQGNEVPAQR